MTFKAYGVKPICAGCGRKLSAKEPLWFVGYPDPAVYGVSCCADKASAHSAPMGRTSG